MADPTHPHPPSPEPRLAGTHAGRSRRRTRARLGGALSATGIVAAALVVVLVQPGYVQGQSGYLTTWAATYTASLSDNNASCILCHGVTATGTRNTGQLNAYGAAVFNAGTNAAGFRSIELLDSDGDGTTNIAEINAGSQPGWRTGANNTHLRRH